MTSNVPQPVAPAAPVAPDAAHRQAMAAFGQHHHDALTRSRRRNGYFHQALTRLVANQVLPGASVLDIGCAAGDMLAALQPAPGQGVGIDINPQAIAAARQNFPTLEFHELAAELLPTMQGRKFDYVILSGVLPQLYDLHTVLEAIRGVCHPRTRLVICTFSRLWHPVISLAETLGHKARVPDESWIPSHEVRNLLGQCDFQVVRQLHRILLPLGIPVLSNLINRWIAPLPGLNHLSLCTLTVARLLPRPLTPITPPRPI